MRKLLRHVVKIICLSIVGVYFLGVPKVYGATSQILSVTPPLFQLSIIPGDIWHSSLKIINGNPYELTVYAEVVNFEARGERGLGRFVPLIGEGKEGTSTLAHWIHISDGPHRIPPEQSLSIPLFVEVPDTAAPGGHFAAVLIGTQPPTNESGSMALLTTQMVTSLFFARIEGDVHELGGIREFTSAKKRTDAPETTFVLRFENKGNVHLIPRGNIVITNMWGKERGVIPINSQTQYGNVLPRSIREYQFLWKGEHSITEIGRYKAVATLAYGEDGVKYSTAETSFYVLPLKATIITLAIIIGFILFLIWAIRLYVRRMLSLAGISVEDKEVVTTPEQQNQRKVRYKDVSLPIERGVIDLRGRMEATSGHIDFMLTIARFMLQYKLFFISLSILITGFVVGVLYIVDASQTERGFEFSIPTETFETFETVESADE